ncbi:hypothetical protein HI914_04645 [Erysiphe necator]|nr:hypothetical protein HI914_04645 [Erysiphe necator]
MNVESIDEKAIGQKTAPLKTILKISIDIHQKLITNPGLQKIKTTKSIDDPTDISLKIMHM